MTFVGKFVLQVDEDEFNFGEITDQPSPDIVLVTFDCPNCREPHGLIGSAAFSVSDFLKREKGGVPVWSFFKTREDMEKYVDSLITASEDDEPAAAIEHVH